MERFEKFDALVERRKGWVDSSRENEFNFEGILAGLYNDPSHFVYEILQNAEDAGAGKVTFDLVEGRLDIYHDGRDFNFEDVEGITGIGKSKKKDEPNKIGEFGVGFKSVFAITETPHIYSGDYSFRIENFVVPVALNSNEAPKGRTKITLPFDHSQRSSEEVFDLVRDRLKNIGTDALLFLESIDEVEWRTPSERGQYYKQQRPVEEHPAAKRVSAISEADQEERFDEYLIFSKPVVFDSKELKVEVAYKLEQDAEGDETIERMPNSKLVVFFPTEKDTYLDFLVQGPYKTTPNRENIDLGDEKNGQIIEKTAELVAESLSTIKERRLLDVGFLRVLPTDDSDEKQDEIYSAVHRSVKEALLEEALLPTSDGGYTSADDALLARGDALTELLDSEDIEFLFSRSNWLDSDITSNSNRTQVLWNYLRYELGVEEVNFKRLAQEIDADFLSTKSDHWMARFYAQSREQTRLWRKRYRRAVLRTKPIIRTEAGKYVAPFDKDDNPQVYLPAEEASEYATVKHSLTDDEDARAFLEEDLGLEPPDLFAEIRDLIVPKYENEDSGSAHDDYFGDLEKMFRAYEQSEAGQKRGRLISQLKDLPFIESVNPETGEQRLQKPTEVYLNTADLREYFAGNDSAWFVSEALMEHFEGGEAFTAFLKELGVAACPRRIKFDPNLSEERKRDLRRSRKSTQDIEEEDFDFEGLDAFLKKEITAERSALLWNLLAQRATASSKYSFFKGTYKWLYYKEKTARFDAKFYETLTQTPWLFDEDGNRKKPSQLTPSQMAAGYDLGSDGADSLLKHLPFKTEAEDKLPEERKQILNIVDESGMSLGELEELLAKEQEASNGEASHEDKWTPDVDPGSPDSTITESHPARKHQPDPRRQSPSSTDGEPASDEESKQEGRVSDADDDSHSSSSKSSKKIGRWGEEHAFEILDRQYEADDIEVVWYNEERDATQGYDLALKKNGEERSAYTSK